MIFLLSSTITIYDSSFGAVSRDCLGKSDARSGRARELWGLVVTPTSLEFKLVRKSDVPYVYRRTRLRYFGDHCRRWRGMMSVTKTNASSVRLSDRMVRGYPPPNAYPVTVCVCREERRIASESLHGFTYIVDGGAVGWWLNVVVRFVG